MQEIEWAAPVEPQRIARAVMPAGCFSLHHASIAHGSAPNTSDGWRIGLAIRYMPCSTRSLAAEETAMLARGVDRFGHFLLEQPPGTDPDNAAVVAQFTRGRELKYRNTMRGAKQKSGHHFKSGAGHQQRRSKI